MRIWIVVCATLALMLLWGTGLFVFIVGAMPSNPAGPPGVNPNYSALLVERSIDQADIEVSIDINRDVLEQRVSEFALEGRAGLDTTPNHASSGAAVSWTTVAAFIGGCVVMVAGVAVAWRRDLLGMVAAMRAVRPRGWPRAKGGV